MLHADDRAIDREKRNLWKLAKPRAREKEKHFHEKKRQKPKGRVRPGGLLHGPCVSILDPSVPTYFIIVLASSQKGWIEGEIVEEMQFWAAWTYRGRRLQCGGV